jgi:hypothetical protein
MPTSLARTGRAPQQARSTPLAVRLALVSLIAFAVVAHHGTAAPLPGAAGHGTHGACQHCPHPDGDESAATGILAACLGLAAAAAAFPRLVGAITAVRAGRHRTARRHLGGPLAATPRPPPRPPELARLCVLLR